MIETGTDQYEGHERSEAEHDTSGNACDDGSSDTGFHGVTFLTERQSLLRPRDRGGFLDRHPV